VPAAVLEMSRNVPYLSSLSVNELLAVCKVANERQELNTREMRDARGYAPPFDVEDVHMATDADLNDLKPLYVELLQEPAYSQLFEIIEKDGPQDGRAAALYALEYPLLVRSTRSDANIRKEPHEAIFSSGDGVFPMHVICRQIATDARLLAWCRDALRRADTMHNAVLASIFGLLSKCSVIPTNPRKTVVKMLGEGGLDSLIKDASGIVRRRATLYAPAVIDAIQLPFALASVLGGTPAIIKLSTTSLKPGAEATLSLLLGQLA
jgi:hypothetical protein